MIIQLVISLCITFHHLSAGTETTADESWTSNWGPEKTPFKFTEEEFIKFMEAAEETYDEILSRDIIIELNNDSIIEIYNKFKDEIANGKSSMSSDSLIQFIATLPSNELSSDSVALANKLINKLIENAKDIGINIAEHVHLISASQIDSKYYEPYDLNTYLKGGYPVFHPSSIEYLVAALLFDKNGDKGVMVIDPIKLPDNKIFYVMEDPNVEPHTGFVNPYRKSKGRHIVHEVGAELTKKGGLMVYTKSKNAGLARNVEEIDMIYYIKHPYLSPALTIKNNLQPKMDELKHIKTLSLDLYGDPIAEVIVKTDGEVIVYNRENNGISCRFQLKIVPVSGNPNNPTKIFGKQTQIIDGKCTTCGESLPEMENKRYDYTFCKENQCFNLMCIKKVEEVFLARGKKGLLTELFGLKKILEDADFMKALAGVDPVMALKRYNSAPKTAAQNQGIQARN